MKTRYQNASKLCTVISINNNIFCNCEQKIFYIKFSVNKKSFCNKNMCFLVIKLVVHLIQAYDCQIFESTEAPLPLIQNNPSYKEVNKRVGKRWHLLSCPQQLTTLGSKAKSDWNQDPTSLVAEPTTEINT